MGTLIHGFNATPSSIMHSSSTSSYTKTLDNDADDAGTMSGGARDVLVMSAEEMERLSILAYGVVGPLIIAVGLLGNCLALVTFLGKTPIWSNGATTTYLKWLAITDTGMQIQNLFPHLSVRFQRKLKLSKYNQNVRFPCKFLNW
jgi:hypothetical protein